MKGENHRFAEQLKKQGIFSRFEAHFICQLDTSTSLFEDKQKFAHLRMHVSVKIRNP